MTFNSVYEITNNLSTIAGQHMIDYISGNTVDDRWYKGCAGSPSLGMNDEVNGGAFFKTHTLSGYDVRMSFNNIDQYSHNSSTFITTVRRDTADSHISAGLQSVESSSDTESGVYRDSSSETYKSLKTADSGYTESFSDVPVGTSFTNVKIEYGSSALQLTINGVLKITKETDRPTVVLQPNFVCTATTTGGKAGSVRYVEAYSS